MQTEHISFAFQILLFPQPGYVHNTQRYRNHEDKNYILTMVNQELEGALTPSQNIPELITSRLLYRHFYRQTDA